MRVFKNRTELHKATKRANLERKIVVEEMKFLKNELSGKFSGSSNLNALLSFSKKISLWFLMRKVLKKIRKPTH